MATETTTTRLPAATTLGAAHLTVADLPRALAFYRDILGFTAVETATGSVTLSPNGATAPILTLTEIAGARPKPPRTTGLYHVAILLPTRLDLGRTLRRLVESDYPLQGASDHLVSEALYLADPDGNGLEIYRDRPREQWRFSGDQIAMDSLPLDLRALLREALADGQEWAGIAPGTRIGHVHLQVADLDRAISFYRDTLGFDLMARMGNSAAFLSAGGYHHHIGLNTWGTAGAPQAPADAVGLRSFDILLPDSADFPAVANRVGAGVTSAGAFETRDPSGTVARLLTNN
ncbi:MAG TPA: VOC family protein [Ktedonobacterales bacterium]|nr:VOC family protein [Ktedonobacterales bacterium]